MQTNEGKPERYLSFRNIMMHLCYYWMKSRRIMRKYWKNISKQKNAKVSEKKINLEKKNEKNQGSCEVSGRK